MKLSIALAAMLISGCGGLITSQHFKVANKECEDYKGVRSIYSPFDSLRIEIVCNSGTKITVRNPDKYASVEVQK